jgi:hypothetical protein
MAYVRREIFTKDKEVQNYLDRLIAHNVVVLPPKMAQDMGRNKTIRNIRELDRKNPYILIGADQKYHVSIIKTREPLKIVKKGDRYTFSL